MTGKVDIFDVASYFLSRVESESGSVMTPLRLQKLVYYAQAWSLALLGRKLFDEEFQAWVHGPVNYALWQRYQGFAPIDTSEGFISGKFTDEDLWLLDEVWETYGQYDAKYLETLTHGERPWQEARKGCAPGDRCNTVISIDLMKEYYSGMLENGEANEDQKT